MKKITLTIAVLITGLALYSQHTLKAEMLGPAVVNNVYTANDTIVEIAPQTVGPFCPKQLIRGDRDFAGRGPEIWASAEMSFSMTAVVVTINFRALETQGGDLSETKGATMKLLYTAPRGFRITAVEGGKKAEVHFVSNKPAAIFAAGSLATTPGLNPKTTIDKNDGLVKSWEIYGDTKGPDISTDDNCDDDTRMKVMLNGLKVKMTKTEAALGIVTIKLEDINEWFCPSRVVRGDREFDGHGPRIKSEVKLRIANGGTQLVADLYLWAKETVHDWSETEGRWSKVVYEAPYGKKITEIVSDKASRTQFMSPAGGFQVLVPGADVARALYTFLDATDIKSAVLSAHGVKPEDRSLLSYLVKGTVDNGNTVVQVPAVEGTLVKFFHIVGDTGGPDISDDNNCNDDTRITKIEFFPVKVKMINTN